MTRAEQEAFEKWMNKYWGEDCQYDQTETYKEETRRAFLSGYRAGFEAQHYEVDDGTRTD